MEVRILVQAGWVAGIWAVVVGGLQVGVVTLGAGKGAGSRSRGSSGDTGLGTVGAIVGAARRAMRLVTVVARAELLCLNVWPRGTCFRRCGG